jgi:aspartyl/asparaginyl beta-hydroxylase (cupin superfamily)
MPESPGRLWLAIGRWVERFQRRVFETAGGSSRPVFFDVLQTAPALDALTKNYSVIRAELDALLASHAALPAYHEIDPRQRFISNADTKKWKVFMLYAMGLKPAANRARCPRTADLLDAVPNLNQAFFSILEAGKSVPAHDGPNFAQLRYHLGLIVPTDNPPSLRVKDQFHTWKQGQAVMFDDTWNHEVINHSAQDRVVLIVDTMRPLPWRLHLQNILYVKVIARIAYAKNVVAIVEKFKG